MTKRIYAADDEQDILDVLQGFLENAGYQVRTFLTGDALYEAFRKEPCDLVVLDLMMPGTDGMEVCRMLREISTVPIIILTAKESEMDHIRGLVQGSDDYLTKPFSPSLLVARIQALLRRAQMGASDAPAPEELRCGDIVLSDREHSVCCQGSPIPLTKTEFSLMRCLLQQPGAAVSRAALLDQVWGIDAQEIETRVTDETVRRIRRKLTAAGSTVRIAGVWGYGYRLEDGAKD